MSNCLIYAIRKLINEGGYLIIRKSHWGPFPHFIWAKNIEGLEVEQYVPTTPKKRKIPPILFYGVVKKRD